MFRHNLLLFCYVAFAQNTETRKVDSFNKLEAGGTFDVVLEQGNENVITIEAKGVDTDFWQMVWVEGLSQSMTLQSLDIKVPLEELYLKTENL